MLCRTETSLKIRLRAHSSLAELLLMSGAVRGTENRTTVAVHTV